MHFVGRLGDISTLLNTFSPSVVKASIQHTDCSIREHCFNCKIIVLECVDEQYLLQLICCDALHFVNSVMLLKVLQHSNKVGILKT